jgi:hypothetical protein
MKKEWKIRQELFHKITIEHNDDLNKLQVEFSNDVVENAIQYFIIKICLLYILLKVML